MAWVIFDLHGSVAALCPAGGTTLSDAYRYDGFGQTIATAGTSTNPWKYRGLLGIDPSAAGDRLYDMVARDYRPATGTFTQLDSLQGGAANPLTMNRYLYALANPTTLIDPDGHMAEKVTGGGAPNKQRNYCDVHPQKCSAIMESDRGSTGGPKNASGGKVPRGVAPINEGIGFHGYAPWELDQDSFVTSVLDDAALNCVGKGYDDDACVVMRSVQNWKHEMGDLWCSIHRAECEQAEVAQQHGTLGWASLAPVVGTPAALVDAKNYLDEGDPLAAVLTVAGTATGAKLLGKLFGFGAKATKADVYVYRSINALTGEVQYVGITNSLARRGAEHLRGPHEMEITRIPGLSALSRGDAKAVEQVLINAYGGPNRQLLNKINSIARTNPIYAQAIGRGCALLISANYSLPPGTCS